MLVVQAQPLVPGLDPEVVPDEGALMPQVQDFPQRSRPPPPTAPRVTPGGTRRGGSPDELARILAALLVLGSRCCFEDGYLTRYNHRALEVPSHP